MLRMEARASPWDHGVIVLCRRRKPLGPDRGRRARAMPSVPGTGRVEMGMKGARDSREIKQFDYEQAKRELTGESDFDKQQAIFDFNEYC